MGSKQTRIKLNEAESRAIGNERSAITSRAVTSEGSVSSGSVLTCGGGTYLHFTLELTRDWSHRAIKKAVLRFRQSSGSGTDYGIVESTEGYILSEGLTREYVETETDEEGNIYRVADITWLISGNPYETKYFALVSYGSGSISLYTEEASSELRPELEIEYVDENEVRENRGILKARAGNAGEGKIDLLTGKTSFTSELFELSGLKQPLRIRLNYRAENSHSTYVVGQSTGMPKGWLLNYQQYIERNGND